ncbi:MAG: hypothetical protein V7K21_23620 [Nostoc sp.]
MVVPTVSMVAVPANSNNASELSSMGGLVVTMSEHHPSLAQRPQDQELKACYKNYNQDNSGDFHQ